MTKLPEYQDWKSPWEKKGEDVDAEKAKKFAYSLLKQNEGLTEQVATATREKDDLQKTVDEVSQKDETEKDRLAREKKKLEDDLAKANVTVNETLKLRVAIRKGLNETQAKRLVGSTEEELESDADALVQSFGGSGEGADDESKDSNPRRQPRRLTTGVDDAGDDSDSTFAPSPDILATIPRI